MVDPGHMCAISIANTTASLVLLDPTLDRVASVEVIQRFVDEVGERLLDEHNKSEDEMTKPPSQD